MGTREGKWVEGRGQQGEAEGRGRGRQHLIYNTCPVPFNSLPVFREMRRGKCVWGVSAFSTNAKSPMSRRPRHCLSPCSSACASRPVSAREGNIKIM
jgi:hypothetical protein